MSEAESVELGVRGVESAVLVGAGGFASVYRAFQPAFERTVAVKVLAASNLSDRDRRKFERECRAMGSLSEHPNIVTLHDAGFTADGRAYFVMSYMAGGSLADRLERAGALGWEEAVRAGLPVADALATSHRAGVLHRDIKPANILMSRYGTFHLGDFGIARLAGQETTQGLSATVAYAPPEVLLGGEPTTASDLYSLGATLFEVITGTVPNPPRADEELVQWIGRIASAEPPDLRSRLVPDDLGELIAAMLDPDPTARPASASAVTSALRSLARSHGVGPAGPGSGFGDGDGTDDGDDGDADGGPAVELQPSPPPPGPAGGRVPTGESTVIVAGQTPAPPGQTPAPPGQTPAPPGPTPAPPGPTPAPPPHHTPAPPPGGGRTPTGWFPTHRVPLTGLAAWSEPDARLPPAAVLDPWLDVQVVQWAGAWALLACSNGWRCWADGRYLEPRG